MTEYGTEKVKLDYLFTLKSAYDTNNIEVFEYILELGCQFYNSNLIEEFFKIFRNTEDAKGFRKKLLLSSFFKVWLIR